MIDDSRDAENATATEFESPPPPHFDESASANAQPVQPIPASVVTVWFQHARSARQMLPVRTKALALVLVGGLAIGALGGTLLVKERKLTTGPAPVVEESAAEASATTDASPDATEDAVPNEETGAAQPGAIELQGAAQTRSRNRSRRARPQTQRQPQAYRVGVIK